MPGFVVALGKKDKATIWLQICRVSDIALECLIESKAYRNCDSGFVLGYRNKASLADGCRPGWTLIISNPDFQMDNL